MIMCTLLSMVYGLFKPCRLTHVTKDITSLMLQVATCFKETALLFNVHFVDFILCAQLTNTCPKLTIKNQINLLNVFKVKNKYSMTSLWCFYCSLRPQSACQYSVSILAFVSKVSKTSHNVLKTQKEIYLFRNKSCKAYFIQ